MASPKKKKSAMISTGPVAQNRRARFDYEIEDTLEAGLVLSGPEVKSLRLGRGNIQESYAVAERGEIWLINSYIPEYEGASHFGHSPRRNRKLLLHKKEVGRLEIATSQKGVTLVPMNLYFNKRGIAKLQIGIGKGKKSHDKRETEKKRDWQREKARLLRENN